MSLVYKVDISLFLKKSLLQKFVFFKKLKVPFYMWKLERGIFPWSQIPKSSNFRPVDFHKGILRRSVRELELPHSLNIWIRDLLLLGTTI